MKNLTREMPEWFASHRKEYEDNIQKTLQKKKVFYKIFSNIVHKVIIEAYNYVSESELWVIYDVDTNTYHEISNGYNWVKSGVNYTDSDFNYCYFEIPTGHTNKGGEYDEHYKLILDGKFNNAPNLSGKDVFIKDIESKSDLIWDFLYFEYKGTRYLIDGNYKIISKFPKIMDVLKSGYVRDNTTHFVLKDDDKWCIYDSETSSIVIKDIVRIVSDYHYCDFKLSNGDIYEYNRQNGKFELTAKYDNFCDTLNIVDRFCYGKEMYELVQTLEKDIIYIMKNENEQFFIVHNNKVINKNCPFDKVERTKEDYKWREKFICWVGDINDIYDKYDTFKFNTLNIEGGETEKLWFDK